MNRGNGRQRIFRADEDCERFLDQLQHSLETDEVILYAYCLMPTHFHLFVETPRANLDEFMRRLQTAYGMYFRYRHQNPGHCFQGRYKAPLVQGDDYALRLTRYIHLNPAKTPSARDLPDGEKRAILEQHRWSSLGAYLNSRHAQEFVDYRWLATIGPKRSCRTIYRRYLHETLTEDDPVLAEAMAASSYAIGDESFREEIAEWVRGAAAEARTPRDVMVPDAVPVPVDALAREVAREFAVSVEDLAIPRRRVGEARGAFLELACRLSGQTQREMAAYLGGLSEQAVSKARRKVRKALHDDPALGARLRAISGRLLKG